MQSGNVVDQHGIEILSVPLDVLNKLRVFSQFLAINDKWSHRSYIIRTRLIKNYGMEVESSQYVGDGKELHLVFAFSQGDFFEFL